MIKNFHVDYDLSLAGIQEIIRKGESRTVEFKEKVPPESIISKYLAGFANSEGGILFFGVSEKSKKGPFISGLTDSEAESAVNQIQKIAKKLFDYQINCQETIIDGKKIVFAIIDSVPEHLKPITTATGEVFERNGTATIKKSKPASPVSSKRGRIKAFVAMSFRNEEEPALVDYFMAMKRACKKTGLNIDLYTMKQVEGDYEISQKIMNEIDASRIIIADFTFSPKNVYFELGYARGCQNKKIIQCARKGTVLEFDVRNWKTLFYKNATDLEVQIEAALMDAYKECVEQ